MSTACKTLMLMLALASLLLLAPEAGATMPPVWAPPASADLEGVVALEDVDGDGLRDLFAFYRDADASSYDSFTYRVYRAGVAPGPGSILEERQILAPEFSFGGAAGHVAGLSGQDLIVRPTTGGVAIWPDFRTTDPAVLVDCDDPDGSSATLWRVEAHRDLDFDADGFGDFTGGEFVFFGSANGPVTSQSLALSNFETNAAAILDDVNGDGQPDLASVYTSLYSEPARLELRFGGAGADLVPDMVIELPPGAVGRGTLTRLDDFDGDGEPDLAVGWGNSPYPPDTSRVSIYRGGSALDDQPDFLLAPTDGLGFRTPRIADAGDVDGDGTSDLALWLTQPSVANPRLLLFYGGAGADGLPDAWIDADCCFAGLQHIEPVGDWDGDGLPELFWLDRIWSPRPIDLNGDGIHDFDQPELFEDCEANGYPDPVEIELGWRMDCNGDGRLDDCELAEDPSLDCNADGIPDECQWSAFDADCNANLILDECEFLRPNTWIDCDGNVSLDACTIAADPAAYDSDGNGRLDWCQSPMQIFAAFDVQGAQTDVTVETASAVDVYVFLDTVGAFDRSQVALLSFGLDLPDAISVQGAEILLPGAVNENLYFSAPDKLNLELHEPLTTTGVVPLARITLTVPAGLHDAAIALSFGSLTPQGALPMAPFWSANGVDTEYFGQFRSAFVNRGFPDCNANEFDDAYDIQAGYSEDLDVDGVPDECQSTVAGAPARSDRLFGARPNPFNPRTEIWFEMRGPGRVRIEVFDAAGRRVSQIVDAELPAGLHAQPWDGRDDSGRAVGSGVYYYRLRIGGAAYNGKLALIR